MLKLFEIRDSQEKKFNKLVKDFNEILVANGKRAIVPMLIEKKDIKCVIRYENEKPIEYHVPGKVYCIEIPEGEISFNGYRPVGHYYNVEGVWQRMVLTDKGIDNEEVNESNFRCDHCHKQVRRKGYWFFRNEKDELLVLGRSCVKKYFGINPDELLEKLGELTEFVHSCSGDYDYEPMDRDIIKASIMDCYALTKYFTADFTYWKKRNAEEAGTSDKVKEVLYSIAQGDRDAIYTYHKACANVKKEELDEINGIKSYWENCRSNDDFTVNVKNLLKEDYFSVRLTGIASFGVFKAIKTNRIYKATRNNSNFVGIIKERMEKNLIAKKSSHYTRQFFTGYSYKTQEGSRLQFEDDNGNVYVSFCTSYDIINEVENNMNKEANYRFTITEHRSEPNGNKINIINRMAIV